jgi:hypothetical protein
MHPVRLDWRHVRYFQAISHSRHCLSISLLLLRCWSLRLQLRRWRSGRSHHGRLTAFVESVIPGGLRHLLRDFIRGSHRRRLATEVHRLNPGRILLGVFAHSLRLPNVRVYEHHSEKHTTDEEDYPRLCKPFDGFCQPVFLVFVESIGFAVEIKVVEMRNHCLRRKDANSERDQGHQDAE